MRLPRFRRREIMESLIEPVSRRLKIAVSSHTALEYRKRKTMRPGNSNLFRPCLIWLSGFCKSICGRKLLCGGCLYYLFYSPSPRIGLIDLSPSPVAKATLSATIRELFTVNRDRAGMDMLRLAQSSGRVVRGWRRGRVTKVPRCGLGSTRPVLSFAPKPRGLLPQLMY